MCGAEATTALSTYAMAAEARVLFHHPTTFRERGPQCALASREPREPPACLSYQTKGVRHYACTLLLIGIFLGQDAEVTGSGKIGT